MAPHELKDAHFHPYRRCDPIRTAEAVDVDVDVDVDPKLLGENARALDLFNTYAPL